MLKFLNNKEGREENGMLAVICFLFFLVGFFVAARYMTGNGSHDFLTHANWGQMLYEGKKINYAAPLWHYTVAFFLTIGNGKISLDLAASLTNGLYLMLVAIAVYKVSIVNVYKENWQKAFLVIMLSILGPLRCVSIVPYYYLGAGTPNVWHNPTYLSVKAISVAVVFLFLDAYLCKETQKIKIFGVPTNRKTAIYTLAGLLAVISMFLKPSFIQGFLPAVGVFLLVELFTNKEKKFMDCVKDGLFLVPCVAILGYQYMSVYITGQTGDNSVGLELFKVLHKFTLHPIKAFFIANAFPIYVMALRWKQFFKDKYSLFAIIYLLVDFVEISLLYETGSRMYHGNFMWAYYLCQFIIWIVTAVRFFELPHNINFKKPVFKCLFGVGIALLFLHVMWGAYYFYNNIYLLYGY